MYGTLGRMGFGGEGVAGDVLEPSCGVGNFMLAAPEGYRFRAVEVDPLSAAIAQALSPDAEVVCAPFEECAFPEGSFSAVIGNVPFSDSIKIAYPGVGTLAIHDYFVLRSLDAVRPGGVVAVVASRFLMDKRGERVRREMARRAELAACVRLPGNAFLEQAGTEVTADVIFLRKRPERLEDADEPWVRSVEVEGAFVNAIVAQRPECAAGRLSIVPGRFGPVPAVRREGDEPLSDAIERLAAKQLERVEDAPGTRARAMAAKAPEPYIAKAPKPSGDYEYVLDEGGRVWFGNGSTVEPVPLPRRDADRLAGMVRIRDLARALLALEASPSADERQVESAMRALNDAYDRFVILHGRLSDKRNAKLYSPSEASYYLLAGLEVTDAKGEFVSKADVFTRRVVAAERPPLERAESAADALAYSIDRKGGFDLSYIAGLLGTDEAGALEELGDLAVVDPETGEALMADEYLSGNLAGKREWLESEIGRLKREPEEGRRAAWLAERGLDAVEPEEGPWPDLKKDLAKSGAWASAVNPLAAERYVAVGAVLNGKGFAGRSAGCGMAAVRDLLEESSRSETPADAAMLNFLTPEFEAAGCPPGETAAYGALLASLHAPKSDAAFAAMARMSLDMARAACRAAGIDAPIRIAGDAAARALAEDEALPEYLLEIALEEEPSYYGRRTYLRATPEGLAAFKRQRRTFLESNPREEDEGRVRKLERLLERVRAAMPPELGPADIALTLGSHWVPPKIVHDFAVETFGLPTRNDAVMRGFSVARSDVLGQWRVSCSGTASHVRAAAREAYGTPERSCLDILSSALNSTDLTVTREGRDGERRRDHAATMAAWERRRALVERFKEWAWEDPGRAAELCRIYNSRFNATAPRSYDGSSLTFPGMSSAVELTKHQRDAIARALLAPEGTLIAHVVGAGKTFDGIAAACEARRLGKARKPLVVVPNHLTEQWAADFVRLYPSARILVMGREDMRGAEAVKRFWGRAATGDWDAVIVAQSRFGMVPVSPRRRIAALESRVEEFAQAREAADESGNLPSVKRIESARKASERKMEQLRAEIDPEGVYFDDLGFDMLVVDEAHNYKNLAVATSISVSGISVSGSQKCEDLLDKCDLIREKNPSNLVFLTGTPVSNSMSELYNMQRYLAPGLLESQGTSSFASWASTFGEITESVELRPEGTGFHIKQRFGRFHNLPELMASFHCYADIKTNSDIELNLPECRIVPVAVEATPEQREAVGELADRAALVRSRAVDPDVDNMLKITGDGRKVALDPKLLDPDGDSDPLDGGKVDACARKVASIWRETERERGCQLVFCDASTPASGKWNIYEDLRERLSALGVPPSEVAFVSDAPTPKRREELFERVREGRTRILVGSTQKLGTGTNVQTRLVATHDLDCPWRPSDLEQRLGRIVRRGNLNERVSVYRYVTSGTFDSYLYQLVQNKQAFISQVFTSESPVREASDLDETVLSYAEIKALATGDPNIQRRMELENRFGQLTLLRSAHSKQQADLRTRIEALIAPRVEGLSRKLEAARSDGPRARAAPPQTTEGGEWRGMEVMGDRLSDRGAACRALWELRGRGRPGLSERVGSYRGFDVMMTADPDPLSGDPIPRIALAGTCEHRAPKPLPHPSASVQGSAIAQMDRVISEIAQAEGKLEGKLAEARAELEEARAELGRPWSHEREYSELSRQLEELKRDEKRTRRPASARRIEGLAQQMEEARAASASTDATKGAAERANEREETLT